MELNALRIVMTVLLLLVFIGIVVWAFSRARRATFDAAARLPLIDDAPPPEGGKIPGNGPSSSQGDTHE